MVRQCRDRGFVRGRAAVQLREIPAEERAVMLSDTVPKELTSEDAVPRLRQDEPLTASWGRGPQSPAPGRAVLQKVREASSVYHADVLAALAPVRR